MKLCTLLLRLLGFYLVLKSLTALAQIAFLQNSTDIAGQPLVIPRGAELQISAWLSLLVGVLLARFAGRAALLLTRDAPLEQETATPSPTRPSSILD